MSERRTSAVWNRPDRKGRFLLVVDSDADCLFSTSMLLQRFEYKTFTASSAQGALTMTAVTVPSLMIVSAGLKDMNGLELMKKLKQEPETANIPFIILKKENDWVGEDQCLQQGAIDSLNKPVSVEQLYRAVQKAIEMTPRSHIRIRTLLPVQACDMSDDCLDNACTTDLSEGGMFVRTTRPAGVHTRLTCQIHLLGQIIEVDAVVLYSNRSGAGLYHEPGMGLQFAQIKSQDRELIRRFVRNEVTRGIPLATA
ncbi:MAG TPA: response regulator [Nitrospirota bacterium]|nr:response regulator [Nitrospirota bacterium]